MEKVRISEVEQQEGERFCLQCKQAKQLQAFPRYKGKSDERRNVCYECERVKQQNRYLRLATQVKMWQQRQAHEEGKQHEWERKVALRQEHEQRWQERDRWYLQQPERRCQACHQLLPATAFGRTYSTNGFVLHTRCAACHEALYERRRLACCLCEQKIPRRDFLSHYDGYALCGAGACVSLCCKRCEAAFHALSDSRQSVYIRACCQRTFPSGQVIYAEVDPETDDIRYVGRTSRPKRRHAQHLVDISPTAGHRGVEGKLRYTRSNWMYALSEKGLMPSMQILQHIAISPLVIEWEQRYIWHGIQQGWELLNIEAIDAELVARIRAASIDILTVPFEVLVQQRFFASHGLVACLHKWCQSGLLER